MPTWLQISLAIGVPLLTVTVTAAVTVITKFAKDREEANAQLWVFVATALKWVGVVAMLVALTMQVLSDAPLTRWAVFGIAFTVAGLAVVFVLSFVQEVAMRILNVVGKNIDAVNKNIEHVGRLITVVEEIKKPAPSKTIPEADSPASVVGKGES